VTMSAPGLTPTPLAASERWRKVPLGWRIVLVVVAAVIAVDLVSSTFAGVTGNGSGASGPSSSYDSSAAGTEALAQLLNDRGHHVDKLTTSIAISALPLDSAVFILDPTSWTAADTSAVRRDISSGDRVILGGPPPASGVLRSLLGVGQPPVWRTQSAGTTHRTSAATFLSGVGSVVAPGPGSYDDPATGPRAPLPLLRGPDGTLALVTQGRGNLVLLASSSPLQNQALGRADNAAFALDLVGTRPVVIDEYDHGFGRAGTGLAGLPASWRWGLGLGLLALVIWVLSAARRFGPPDEPDRITVPPRVRYVDAMATLLSTRPPDQMIEATRPVSVEARRRLCRHLGLPSDASDDVLAARLAHGWDATVLPVGLADAVVRPPRSTADVIAVGTALSELDREANRP
jgi:hypothetical protein